ncbi:MAG: Na+/H+ antiporter NhaA [Bacteroidaceae bacterium]|nr:Na+/H+ antiporter NhaA [Bacteroidaceae bacterium]
MKILKIGKINFSFLEGSQYRINGGILLMGIVLLAMIIANSPLGQAYTEFWTQKVYLQIGEFNFFNHHGHPMTLMTFINDVLMTLFFFSVGLEIKREILVGELCSIRKALLPIIAACGGMIVPVLIYYYFTAGTDAESGLAIPMATDIAFSLGVLSLFGRRVPISLKIFLTAFAVVDDIGGILVIALFYSTHLDITYLLYALGVLFILISGNRMHIFQRWFYISFGIVLWYFFLQSGVHATIAGVIVAFTIPASPHYETGRYINSIKESISFFPTGPDKGMILNSDQINILKSIESASDRVISPLQSLEDELNGAVNYVILPLFAFANAGIVLNLGAETNIGITNLTMAVALGLVVGKFIGIYLFTWLAIKLRLSTLSQGMTWANLTGISLLGGIGFTVSLFIANLSFSNQPELLDQAKLGVLLGTLIAGLLGYITLHFTLPRASKKTIKS